MKLLKMHKSNTGGPIENARMKDQISLGWFRTSNWDSNRVNLEVPI